MLTTGVPAGRESSGVPARILVAGSDLLADALAAARSRRTDSPR